LRPTRSSSPQAQSDRQIVATAKARFHRHIEKNPRTSLRHPSSWPLLSSSQPLPIRAAPAASGAIRAQWRSPSRSQGRNMSMLLYSARIQPLHI
jgi:hypothetical protein